MDPAHAKNNRETVLEMLAGITAIERGTLTEEHRERPGSDGGGPVRRGPYFKHQCWENGRNRSVRIPPGQVALLREHLENGRRFDELALQLARHAIEEGRAQRLALSSATVADIEVATSSMKNVTGKGRGDEAKKKVVF
jgi:hypothetical protein